MRKCIRLTVVAFSAFMIQYSSAVSQSVAINDNGAIPHASAILDVNVAAAAKKGVLIPRMTTAERVAIAAPAKGLLVFDNTTSSFWYYNGTAWSQLAGSSVNYWTLSGTNIYNNNTGNVGIGLTAPRAKFHVVANRSVVFGADSLSNSAGPQFVWFGKKAALRIRRQAVSDEYPASAPYNYAQIGENSLAIGNAIASSRNTLAIGDAHASGAQSFAQGFGATAEGFYSYARGFGAYAAGNDAFAQGTQTSAIGDESFAFGFGVSTTGYSSFAHGADHTVTGSYASAFGYDNSARAHNSFVIGRYNDSIASSSQTTWVATDPLFIIGNGTGFSTRANALVVLKNAITGIGVNPVSTTIDFGMLQIKSLGSRDNLTLIQSSTSNRWGLYVGGSGPDLNLYLNGVYKGRFDNVDGAYIMVSDRRLKKDISPITAVLSKVLLLKAYQYHYSDNDTKDQFSHGFMAQDIETLFPEFVSRTADKEGRELLGLNYNKFAVLAIKAIQEQQEIINTQVEMINQHEAINLKQQKQISELEARLKAIEAKLK
jgi:hypothetical protein